MALPHIYYPEINLGFITIYSFGLIVAIAFLVGLWLNVREAKRLHFNPDIMHGIMFYIILGSIVGSRLAHIFGNWSYYSDNLIRILMLWEGGLTFYGGFIGAVVFSFTYLKIKKLKFIKYADIYAPSIALGHAIGRIGCVVGDGGHMGKVTSLPWGMFFDGAVRHPTALYGVFNLLILFGLLMYLRKKKFFRGFMFSFYVAYYAFTRFFIEFLRVDQTFYGLTGSQWVAIPLFILSTGYILKKL